MSLRLKIFFYFFGIIISLPFLSDAQQTIEEKIERKVSISPYLGVGFFPNNINVNKLGVPQNLFSGYSPAPTIGITGWYKWKKRVSLGLDGSFMNTTRPTNDLQVIGLGIFAKFNIISTKKNFSPYLIGGINASFINIDQPRQTRSYFPSASDSAVVGSGISTEKIDYNYNQLNLYMAPLLGPILGIGFDVKISRKISFFAQGMVHSSTFDNPIIQEAYPINQSLLQFANLRVGANIKLFKKMKFEIDTEAVRIPDPIVMLNPNELELERQQMLNREGSFDVNLREGLKHTTKLNVNDGELNIVMDSEGSPCKTLAVLYDQYGNKLSSAYPDENGHVNFTSLDKGIYNVAFEVQPPCPQSTNLTYKIGGGDEKILAQSNETYTPKSDTIAYDIDGFVDFKENLVASEGVTVMLVDNSTKEVKSKQSTTKDGSFSFKNLNPGDYKVVYEVPNSNVQSRIAYNIVDNQAHIIKQENMPFNDLKPKSKDGTRLMTGHLDLSDPKQAYKVSLDLVDKYNRVVDHSLPNDDGNFEFIDRKNDQNDVIFELSDKNKNKGKASGETITRSVDNIVKGVTYKPTIEDPDKIKEIMDNANNTINKMALGLKPTKATYELEMYKMYNRDGDHTSITGFGFQVGAFRNIENVYHLMDRLKAEGFDAYVQAVMSQDVAGKFKPSSNYKLYRVVVFGSDNEINANTVKNKLQLEGFDIITKEHFKPIHQFAANNKEKTE